MTKRKIFPAILYFIITFLIGIFLSVIMPPAYLYGSDLILDVVADSLENGEYVDAMELYGGYFNAEYVLKEDFAGGGSFVLFEAIALNDVEKTEGEGDDAQTTTLTFLRKAYVGMLFGAKDNYRTSKEDDNKTGISLTVLDDEGNAKEEFYEILDKDSDKKSLGYSVTYEKRGVLIIELDADTYPAIEKLSFIDCEGVVYSTIDFSEKPLDFSSEFYQKSDLHVQKYNEAVLAADGSSALEDAEGELKKNEKDFLGANENYRKSAIDKAEKVADKKATRTVIIYFVIIYVVADLLFTGFIVKFIKFMIFDVFKVKRKDSSKIYEENFGNDYYCSVTMKLDVQENSQFDQTITVRYGEGEKTLKFTLGANDGYETYQRIKAGDYAGLKLDVPEGYAVEGLPETLNVSGYKKNITAKIVRLEDNVYEDNN